MSDESHVSPHNLPILKTLLQSLAFGISFLLLTAALLWRLALYSWWRDGIGILDPNHQGGFACIGIFAITSAAYFISKLFPRRFMTALIIVAVLPPLTVSPPKAFVPHTGPAYKNGIVPGWYPLDPKNPQAGTGWWDGYKWAEPVSPEQL